MKCGRILASSFSRNERRLAARQCENVEMWKCGVENWEAGVAFVTPQAAKTRGAVLCSGVNKRARSWHKARRTGGQWLEQWNRKDSGQDEDVDEDAETGGHDDSRSCIGSRWTALIEPCYVDSNAFQCVAKQRVDPITYCHRFPASRLSLLAGKSSNCCPEKRTRVSLMYHHPIQSLLQVSCSSPAKDRRVRTKLQSFRWRCWSMKNVYMEWVNSLEQTLDNPTDYELFRTISKLAKRIFNESLVELGRNFLLV